jgi:hypothetical protein
MVWEGKDLKDEWKLICVQISMAFERNDALDLCCGTALDYARNSKQQDMKFIFGGLKMAKRSAYVERDPVRHLKIPPHPSMVLKYRQQPPMVPKIADTKTTNNHDHDRISLVSTKPAKIDHAVAVLRIVRHNRNSKTILLMFRGLE